MAIAALVVMLQIPTSSVAQVPHDQGTSIGLTRQNFETAFTYQTEPTAKATVSCVVDDLQVTIDWGDGGMFELMSHTVESRSGGAHPTEVYDLFSGHKYTKSGTYEVAIELSAKCHGGGLVSDRKKYSVGVFDHVGIAIFMSPRETVRRGTSLSLTITLRENAPASGTRIYLQIDKPHGVFPEQSFPIYVDIPEKADHVHFSVPVLSNASVGPLKMTAFAGDGTHLLFVTVE